MGRSSDSISSVVAARTSFTAGLTASPDPATHRNSLTPAGNMDRRHNSTSLDRLHTQASTLERSRGSGNPALTPPATSTGSLNKKRQSATDSPNMSRNPLRKLSSSSLGQHGVSSSASGDNVGNHRSKGPELPEVHFFNAKMQCQLQQQSGSRPSSMQVQNDIFDSLKTRQSRGGGACTTDPSPSSPTSPKSTVSDGARAVKTMTSPSTSRHQIAPGHSLRKVSSEPNCKPPAIPVNSNITLYTRPNPPIYKCISPTTSVKPQLKVVTEYEVLEDPIISNTDGAIVSPPKHFHAKTIPTTSRIDEINEDCHYGQLSQCSSRPPPPPPAPPIQFRHSLSHDNEEENFVTGVYREPIDRCLSTTPSQRSNASSEQTVIIHDDISELASSPTKARSGRQFKGFTSPGLREPMCASSPPASSPSPGGLMASIDGKNMSLLPDPDDEVPPPLPPRSAESLRKRSSLDMDAVSFLPSNDLNHSKNINDCNKKENRKSYPAVPNLKAKYFSPPRQRRETFNPNFVSDDEKDSVSSRPHSDHSSIVFLNPIELKPSKNALIRQLPNQEVRPDVLNYIFTSPCGTLDRFRSRSSDTINSIPHCPPTPKFPLIGPSDSLTRLLQELTAEADSQYYDDDDDEDDEDFIDELYPRRENYMPGMRDENIHSNNNIVKVLSTPPQSPPSDRTRARLLRKKFLAGRSDLKRASAAGRKAVAPRASPTASHHARASVINPFQIKRRQPHSCPPRHCRSLDYIASDLEDDTSTSGSSRRRQPLVYQVPSSNGSQTSAVDDEILLNHSGSPKSRHAYLMPLIFGARAVMAPSTGGLSSQAEHTTSLSSLASSSSDLSHSDPHTRADSGSAAYESEYDNYRPGHVTSDGEDLYFCPGRISDVEEAESIDDVNVDDVTVSDNFSMDMPVPRFHKKTTQV